MEDVGPRGLQAISNIIDDPAHPQHATVAMYVVNRWKGTPTVKTEIGGPGGGPIPIKTVLTSDEKRARVAALIETARARVRAASTQGDDSSGSE